jgi:mono/diheme cytochrome c family protein
MKWRWVAGVVAVPCLIALAFAGWVYAASESHLRSFARPAAFTHPIPTDAAAIARGDHLVRTRGCRGCHGDDLGGQVMWGVAVAPNLAVLARSESPAVLEAAIRHGIGRDGRALYSMPAYNFVRMRDEDLADIIAYLRTVPVARKGLPHPGLPFEVRREIALGRDAAIAAYLDRVPPLRRADDPDLRMARGEYTAMTTCNECHGFGLRADTPWEDETAPDLIIVAGYSEADFRRLMREGIAIGDRELEMMSGVARGRFAYFTEDELSDLYAFLRDMSARAIAEGSGTVTPAAAGAAP